MTIHTKTNIHSARILDRLEVCWSSTEGGAWISICDSEGCGIAIHAETVEELQELADRINTSIALRRDLALDRE